MFRYGQYTGSYRFHSWQVLLCYNSVYIGCLYSKYLKIIMSNSKYNIIRKIWKGMNQTKLEGGTERHLPKADDRCRRVRRESH